MNRTAARRVGVLWKEHLGMNERLDLDLMTSDNEDRTRSRTEYKRLWIRERRQDPEVRARKQRYDRERRQDPTFRAQQAQRNRERRQDPEVRQQDNDRNRERMRQRRKDPEVLERERERMRQRRKDPEVLEREREQARQRRERKRRERQDRAVGAEVREQQQLRGNASAEQVSLAPLILAAEVYEDYRLLKGWRPVPPEGFQVAVNLESAGLPEQELAVVRLDVPQPEEGPRLTGGFAADPSLDLTDPRVRATVLAAGVSEQHYDAAEQLQRELLDSLRAQEFGTDAMPDTVTAADAPHDQDFGAYADLRIDEAALSSELANLSVSAFARFDQTVGQVQDASFAYGQYGPGPSAPSTGPASAIPGPGQIPAAALLPAGRPPAHRPQTQTSEPGLSNATSSQGLYGPPPSPPRVRR